MAKDLTPKEAAKIVQEWARDKPLFNQVRDLMGFLAHSEIAAAAHGHKTGTGFVQGANKWNLDELYQAAIHAHPKTRKKILAQYEQKGAASHKQQPAGRESVRDSISRAVTGKPTDKPKAESVRASIDRARSEAKGR
jgi:hypothetical protein